MPVSCCVYGCTQGGGKASNTEFFWFPEDAELQRKWKVAVKRLNGNATAYTRIQKHYSKVGFIIDCTEVFIERPTSLEVRSQMSSNYEKHNTIKFLIAIAPSGVICFLSKSLGGRVSDKERADLAESGFVSHLEPTDEIMADWGFIIEEELALQGTNLTIPASTKGKKQLPQKDIELSRQMQMCMLMWSVLVNSWRIDTPFYKLIFSL